MVTIPSSTAVRWIPKTDIYITETDLVVEIELPGVKRSDLTVSIARDGLYIEGVRRRSPKVHSSISFYNLEIDYGPFERRIYFPTPVDPRKLNASFEDGVLIIVLKRSRPIEFEIPIVEE